jgi:hypothetical protein
MVRENLSSAVEHEIDDPVVSSTQLHTRSRLNAIMGGINTVAVGTADVTGSLINSTARAAFRLTRRVVGL